MSRCPTGSQVRRVLGSTGKRGIVPSSGNMDMLELQGFPPSQLYSLPCCCPWLAAGSPQPSCTQEAPFGRVLLTSTRLRLLLGPSRQRDIQVLVSVLCASCSSCQVCGWCHWLQLCPRGHGPLLLRTGPCGAATHHDGLGEAPAEKGVHGLVGQRAEAEILPGLNAIPTGC